jgi:hypothetical protein
MKHFSSEDYIKIAIANTYGLDRLDWDKRLNWINSLIVVYKHNQPDNLNGTISAIYELESTQVHNAKEPMMFRKACHALCEYLLNKPSGYFMMLDATASGLQILSCLIGCHDTARNTNLLGGSRVDVYEMVAKGMSDYLGDNVSREDVKKPVMVTFYGSKAEPKVLFGEDTPELNAFYEILDKELGGAVEAMNDIQSCWNPNVLVHEWTLPDGHTAYVPVLEAVDKKIEIDELEHRSFTHRAYINKESTYGISLAANVVHSIDGFIVREMKRRCAVDGGNQIQELYNYLCDKGIVPNEFMLPPMFISHVDLVNWTPEVIDELDHQYLVYIMARCEELLSRPAFELVTIHDCFGARPKHMNAVRNTYKRILAEIAASDMLSHILSEITGQEITVVKRSTSLALEILTKAEYALS